MNEKYVYSASKNSFFPISLKSDYESGIGWPDDAKEVSFEEFSEYTSFKKGYRRTPNKNGMPSWVLCEDLETSKSKKSRLISEADSTIRPLLGYALSGLLSEREKDLFKAWNEYRKTLENIDTTDTDIKWPKPPIKE